MRQCNRVIVFILSVSHYSSVYTQPTELAQQLWSLACHPEWIATILSKGCSTWEAYASIAWAVLRSVDLSVYIHSTIVFAQAHGIRVILELVNSFYDRAKTWFGTWAVIKVHRGPKEHQGYTQGTPKERERQTFICYCHLSTHSNNVTPSTHSSTMW